MQYVKEDIVSLIQDIVMQITQAEVTSEHMNLLDTELNIHPADFLYIFDQLEQELSIPVADVLKENHYTIFEIGNLSEALLNMLEIKN